MMNRTDQDDLDAFLWEVDQVSQQVKDLLSGKIDIDKIKEKENFLKEKKEKEEQMKKFKEEEDRRQKEEILKRGTSGKGEKDNYIKLCKKCFVEYQIEMEKCFHCGRDLMKKEDRHIELKEKVEVFKENKTKKKFRKQKYENWLKTEAILKTNTINFKHYQKWDLYESSSDEDEKGEPIVPRNDPNFLALEKDILESNKKREISRNKAIKLKDEGNQMLKEGRFKKAINLYSEAIEEFKGIMSLYTNRALAYIKIEDYDSALTDCDKVIEYLDVFDEELKNNKDLYVKALSRKSICLQKLKDFGDSKICIEKALNYVKDEEMEKLYKNILLEEELHTKALNVIKGDVQQFEILDKFIKSLRESTIDSSVFENLYLNTKENEFEKIKLLLKVEENNKLYFIQKGGLELILSHIKKFNFLIDIIEVFTNNQDKNFYLLINNLKGFNKIIYLLFDEKDKNKNTENKIEIKITHVKTIVGILEDASQHEEVRKVISEMKHLNELFTLSFTKYDISSDKVINDSDSVIILMRIFTFVCNIAYSSTKFRIKISEQYNFISEKIKGFIKNFNFSNYLNTNLIESLISFLINISCDENFRTNLMKEEDFIKFIVENILKKITSSNYKKNEDLYEKSISLLYNLNYKDDLNKFYLNLGLDEIIKFYILKIYDQEFKKHNEISLIRTMMMTIKLVKIEYTSFFITEKEKEGSFYFKISEITNLNNLKINSKIVDNSIKILAHYLSKLTQEDTEKLNYVNPHNLVKSLSEIFLNDYDNIDREKERVVNTMSLMISLIGRIPSVGLNMKGIVEKVIQIAKDKVDLLRKNAAILLAKIAKSSEEMQSYVRGLHGMDVLLNVAKFIQLEK